jgi:guanylate kinase
MTADDATRPDDRSPTAAGETRLTVLSGPSGVGKDSVIEMIRARAPWVWLSVSLTTRRIRDTEIDGGSLPLCRPAGVLRLAESGQLLEWAEFAGNLYGTREGRCRSGSPSATQFSVKIDLQGAATGSSGYARGPAGLPRAAELG